MDSRLLKLIFFAGFALAPRAGAQPPMLACPPALLSHPARFFTASPDDLTQAYRLLLENVAQLPDGADRLRRMHAANELFSVGLVTDSAQIPLVDALDQFRRFVEARADAGPTHVRLTDVLKDWIPEADQTVSRARTSRVEEAQPPGQIWTEKLSDAKIESVRTSRDGGYVVAHSQTQGWLLHPATRQVLRFVDAGATQCVAISPSGNSLAVSTTHGVKIYSVDSAAPLQVTLQATLQRDFTGIRPENHGFFTASDLVFTADGSELLLVAHRTLERYNSRSGEKIENVSIPFNVDYISEAAMTADGQRIALNLAVKGLLVFGKGMEPLHQPITAIHHSFLRFSDDETKVFVLGHYNGVHVGVLDVERRQLDTPTLPFPLTFALSGDFSRMLYTRWNRLHIGTAQKSGWNPAIDIVGTFPNITSLHLSSDGKVAAFGDDLGVIRIFHPEDYVQ